MKSKWLSAAALLLFSGTAWGQMTPQQQANLPPSNPNSSQYNTVYLPAMNNAQPPQERWADRWGAIASDGDVTYGIVTDMVSKDEAKRSALAECKKRGGGACSIERYFVNQCAVVIAGDGATASSNAPTVDEAVEIGMPICSENGGTNCHVYYSGCSLPVRLD
jgi:hypothetical protein